MPERRASGMVGRKLPVGIQGFVGLRNDGYIYVDKTAYIYRLVHEGKSYFLNRPRGFGKSLLLSTLKAYWEGKKELFSGLAIEKLEEKNEDAWKPHPVFSFDFSGFIYQEAGALERVLSSHLRKWETQYGLSNENNMLGERFKSILTKAKDITSYRSVILVDKFDKPLLDVIDNRELREHNREVLNSFFSATKSCDEYIQFVFVTGVTNTPCADAFNGFNQLTNISLTKKYAELCGFTEHEIDEYFADEIDELTKVQAITEKECREQLKQTYAGYRFHPKAREIYNPYSLLCAFSERYFGSYWLETDTLTLLIGKASEAHIDIRNLFDKTIFASESVLKGCTSYGYDLVSLLYQTGYLTISNYDRRRQRYTLCFPNEEVKDHAHLFAL